MSSEAPLGAWPKRGIGVYDDTPGSPPLALQLTTALRLLGPAGWLVLFLQPALPGPAPLDTFVAKLRAAYDKGFRVVVRVGWKGAMRDYCDAQSNSTRYTHVAAQLAALVTALPLPPVQQRPLLVHVGNELNACNEWRCTTPRGAVYDVATRAREVGGFMQDTFAQLSELEAARNGSMWLAHASIANWMPAGCECGTNRFVGPGSPGTKFLAAMLNERPALYTRARWLSSHSYPYSNSNYSSEPTSKAYRGLTYYRAERAALNAPAASLPAVLTETGWARNSVNNRVSEKDQAAWMARAAKELWAPDASVLAVAPFLLAGRFWEATGHNFVDCPSANSTAAPCDAPLREWPVFRAWAAAGMAAGSSDHADANASREAEPAEPHRLVPFFRQSED